jgi:hypothetical protein
MGEEEAVKVMSIPAEKLISAGKFRDAEKLLLVMGQAAKVVEMYREQKRYDEVNIPEIHMTIKNREFSSDV